MDESPQWSIEHDEMDDRAIEEPSASEATELALCFARTFQTSSGRRALQHLRSITLGRTVGPAATDSALRHREGQRQLVAYVTALVDRGRTRPSPDAEAARSDDFD